MCRKMEATADIVAVTIEKDIFIDYNTGFFLNSFTPSNHYQMLAKIPLSGTLFIYLPHYLFEKHFKPKINYLLCLG